MENLYNNIKYVKDNINILEVDSTSCDFQNIKVNDRVFLSFRFDTSLILNYTSIENLVNFYGHTGVKKKNISKINDINFIKEIENNNEKKLLIVETEMHPIGVSESMIGFKKFFDINSKLTDYLREKKILLFIYFGWEADDWTNQNEGIDFLTYFKQVLFEYKIPNETIVFLNSNLRGNELTKKRYYLNSNLPFVWYDNWMEFETFVRKKNSTKLDYTFDEHFNILKNKCKYKFLRVNRTQHFYRDLILYFSKKLNLFSDTNWEHRIFDEEILKSYLNEFQNLAFNFYGFSRVKNKNFINLLDYSPDIVNKIKELLPLISSYEEKNSLNLLSDSISNETIPASIYTTAPISYVSTSFPNRETQVFLHMSTFNPIFNYHPILYNGNQFSLRELKKSGFQTFSFLFDEKYDRVYNSHTRFIYSFNEYFKVNKFSMNQILDIIYNNQDVLIHNRNQLLKINSKQHFFQNLVDHIKKYYKNES